MEEKRPEQLGISPGQILRMMDRCEEEIHHLHGFLIARDGALVTKCFYRPFSEGIPKNGYSLGKSLTSLAIGFAIDEGLLSFDTQVTPMFRDELPDHYDPRLEQLTIRDLLTMAASSAVASTTFSGQPDDQWVKHYYTLKPFAKPGTEFHYDTGGMYLLSCVISKVTGQNVLSYLRPRLLEPLGITGGWWLEDGKGRNVGGWGIYLPIEDGIRIAQTLADGGKWMGRQVVPAWYVQELAECKIDTAQNPHIGWKYGYSYGFWKGKESIFLAFGAFGQLWICDPKRRMSVVTSAGCSHEENVRLLEIVQDTLLLPTGEGPLPYDEEGYQILCRRLQSACLPYPEGAAAPEREDVYGEYRLLDNGAGYLGLRLERLGEARLSLTLVFADRTCTLTAGYQDWQTQKTDLDPTPAQLHSFAYAWQGQTLHVVQHQLDQPSSREFTLSFADGGLTLTEVLHPSLVTAPPEEIRGKKEL